MTDLANFKTAYQSRGAAVDAAFCRKTRGSLEFDDKIEIKKALRLTKLFGSYVVRLTFYYRLKCKVDACDNKYLLYKTLVAMEEYFLGYRRTLQCWKVKIVVPNRWDCWTYRGSRCFADRQCIEEHRNVRNGYVDSISSFRDILSYCENVRSIILDSGTIYLLPETTFDKNENLLTLKIRGWIGGSDLRQIVDKLINTRLEEMSFEIKGTINYHDLFRLETSVDSVQERQRLQCRLQDKFVSVEFGSFSFAKHSERR